MFTRRHFRSVAKMIATIEDNTDRRNVAKMFAKFFIKSNTNFKPDLFLLRVK